MNYKSVTEVLLNGFFPSNDGKKRVIVFPSGTTLSKESDKETTQIENKFLVIAVMGLSGDSVSAAIGGRML